MPHLPHWSQILVIRPTSRRLWFVPWGFMCGLPKSMTSHLNVDSALTHQSVRQSFTHEPREQLSNGQTPCLPSQLSEMHSLTKYILLGSNLPDKSPGLPPIPLTQKTSNSIRAQRHKPTPDGATLPRITLPQRSAPRTSCDMASSSRAKHQFPHYLIKGKIVLATGSNAS